MHGHVTIKFPLPGLHVTYEILMHLSFNSLVYTADQWC